MTIITSIYVIKNKMEIEVHEDIDKQCPWFKQILVEKSGWKYIGCDSSGWARYKSIAPFGRNIVWENIIGQWLNLLGFTWSVEILTNDIMAFRILSHSGEKYEAEDKA